MAVGKEAIKYCSVFNEKKYLIEVQSVLQAYILKVDFFAPSQFYLKKLCAGK